MSALIWIIIGFAVLWMGMGGFFLYRILSYKHDYILKRPQGNSFIAYRTKAKEITLDDGTTRWKLLKFRKDPVPVPASEYMNTNRKGKFYVEAWELADGQIQYEKSTSADSVDTSSTNQKVLLAEQIRSANDERYKNWKTILPQIIIPLGALLILGVVVVMGMIFWQDLTAPGLEAKEIATNQMEIQREIVAELKEIRNDIQIIDEVRERRYIENQTIPN